MPSEQSSTAPACESHPIRLKQASNIQYTNATCAPVPTPVAQRTTRPPSVAGPWANLRRGGAHNFRHLDFLHEHVFRAESADPSADPVACACALALFAATADDDAAAAFALPPPPLPPPLAAVAAVEEEGAEAEEEVGAGSAPVSGREYLRVSPGTMRLRRDATHRESGHDVANARTWARSSGAFRPGSAAGG